MTRPSPRWTIDILEAKVRLLYYGQQFADVFPTHGTGLPGLQIVSNQLDFRAGMLALPDKRVLRPFVTVGGCDFTDMPVGPATWVAFLRRP